MKEKTSGDTDKIPAGLVFIVFMVLCMVFAATEAVPYLEWGLLTPGITLALTAVAMRIGIVAPLTGAALSNVIPTPIYLWMANNSISGLIWGFLMVAVSIVI